MFLKPSNCKWYTGPTLMELISSISIPSKETKPLRGVVDAWTDSDVFELKALVYSGTLKLGERVMFLPRGLTTYVDSISVDSEPVSEAYPMETVCMRLRGPVDGEVKQGSLIVALGEEDLSIEASETERFVAEVLVLDKLDFIYYRLWCHVAKNDVALHRTIQKNNRRTGKAMVQKPTGKSKGKRGGRSTRPSLGITLKMGDTGLIELLPHSRHHIAVETFVEHPFLGRVILLDDKDKVIAVGTIRRADCQISLTSSSSLASVYGAGSSTEASSLASVSGAASPTEAPSSPTVSGEPSGN